MSAADLVKFYKSKDFDALELSLKKMSEESLINIIDQFVIPEMNDFGLLVLKAILHGSQHNRNKVIVELYKKANIALQSKDFNQDILSDTIYVLNNEMNGLDSKSSTDLCQTLVDIIKDNTIGLQYSLKLFQKIIDILPQHLTVCYNKQIISGVEFRKNIVEDICSYKWQNNSRIHFITMFVDLNLSNLETDIVIKKFLFELEHTVLSELPLIVFQLLIFASKCNKAQMIVEGIICHVNKLTNANNCENIQDDNINNDFSDESCEIIGTILLYIANSLKQNLMLGRNLLKIFKTPKTTLNNKLVSSFFFAVSMLLVQDGRFCEDILTSLRILIIKSLQDAQKRNSRKCLQDRTEKMFDIKDLLFCVAINCGRGWSLVVSGIVSLGFSLISTFGSKKGFFGKSCGKDFTKFNNPQFKACKIGSDLISISFKSCKIIRKDIVKKLAKYIQGNLSNPANHYLKLLKSIAKLYPHTLLLSSDQLTIILDDLPHMHPNNAQMFFDAIFPLIKSNSDLRNNLILVLRKTLSSRVETTRICALQGFIMFLINFPITEFSSLSQLSSQSSQSIFSSASFHENSQHSTPSPAQNRMLCMEIIQAIKKCLKQQFNVRKHLYVGACDIAVANPLLSTSIIEILLDHFLKFYEDDADIIPPFSVKSCFSKQDESAQEPLSLLLMTISLIMKKACCMSHDDEESSVDEELVQKVKSIFNSFSERLCKCELDDFDFAKTSNSSSNLSNTNALILVLSLHQVMIEHWMSTTDDSDKAINLFHSYKRFYDHCCQHKPNNFDKALADSISGSSSLANLSCALTILLKDDNILSDHENFTKHMMVLLHNFLLHMCEPSFSCKRKKFLMDSEFDNLVTVSRLCYHKFMTEKNSPDLSSLLYNCLECFHSATKAVMNLYQKKVFQFFSDVCGNDCIESQTNSLRKLVGQIQRSVITFISTGTPLSSDQKKLLSELLSLLETFLSIELLLSKYKDCKQFADWSQKLCKEYEIEDTSSSKRAVNLFLFSSLHISDHPELPFRDFCTDIHIILDSSEEVGKLTSTYKIISSENISLLILILTKHLNNVIADCDWLLAYVKSRIIKPENTTIVNDEACENRRKIEGSLCVRICTIGVGLLDLLTADMENVAAIEAVIVSSTTYFNFLIQLCKYYLWLYAQSLGTIPTRFEKLVSFIGSELMKPIYAFIMHAQSTQSSKLSKDGKSKKTGFCSVAGRAKILRESKSISQLVYSIEQHEHHLILLARKTKTELMKDYHLPTSRDFRIRTDVIHINAIDEEALKEKINENMEEENQIDDTIPSSKKRRLLS